MQPQPGADSGDSVTDTIHDVVLPAPDDPNPVDIEPKLIYQSQPLYPPQAVEDSAAGTVQVRALVDERGKVIRAEVAESSGWELLDKAAVEAAYKNKYRPAVRDGLSVKYWVTYPVEFSPPGE